MVYEKFKRGGARTSRIIAGEVKGKVKWGSIVEGISILTGSVHPSYRTR